MRHSGISLPFFFASLRRKRANFNFLINNLIVYKYNQIMSFLSRVQSVLRTPRRPVGDEILDLVADSDPEDGLSTDSDSVSSSESDFSSLGPENETVTVDENTLLEGVWQNTDRPPTDIPFLGNSRIVPDLSEVNNELDFFSLFVNDEMINLLCVETNRYAQQKRATLTGSVRMRKWTDTNPQEMKQFVAILFVMGIIAKPNYSLYWTKNTIFSTPFFPSAMSRDRFYLLMSALHVSDNTTAEPRGQPGFNRLHKIQPIVNLCRLRFKEVYQPERELAIDETMVPWTGRLSFKQYIPIKPDKYGVKLFQICESSTGYSCDFEVYAGKDDQRQPAPGQCVTDKLVMDLMEPFLQKGHVLYMDNYYSSVQLYEDLRDNRTLACGTFRLNRKGLPADLKTKTLKKGEHIFRRKDDLLALKWHDKKVVTFLSTAHSAEFRTNAKDKLVPVVKMSYDNHMNGVDKNDQNVGYYSMRRKFMRWYKKIIVYLLNLCRFQGYVIYRKSGKGLKLTHLEFTQRLVFQLMERSSVEKAAAQPVTFNRLECVGDHFPEIIPPTEKKKYPTRKCVLCSYDLTSRKRKSDDSARRHESRYTCLSCQVPLCITPRPCFRDYHTKLHFKSSIVRAEGATPTT